MGIIKPTTIEGVVITPLARFPDDRGMVMHILKSSDQEFQGFGEVYCSSIYPGVVKAWHFHEKITLHYVVVRGMIKFVLFDERDLSPTHKVIQEIFMGDHNYVRVTVPPGIWSGFMGIGVEPALVCNVINHPHDETEIRRCDPHHSHIPYSWARPDK
ncbi:dTDP-4-dehydrorhamnose 3,5-epimerase family protein [candidate division CSSED10-310 bacterium]|uniref:dTDP-4-dehydrorhamnose 3,5-epimerase family protein n=1 Tax=candidate division CSSED10-310 bacterium TaxID=2855610 RepID=A0ABV6YS68_UNCC1